MSIDPYILRQLQKAREKKPPKIKKPIAKVSEKRKTQIAEEKILVEKDEAFYLSVWEASPHNCQNCDVYLGKTCNSIFMHHLLPKTPNGPYAAFRHVPANIAILCLECHSKCETNYDFIPKIKERRNRAESECLKWITE